MFVLPSRSLRISQWASRTLGEHCGVPYMRDCWTAHAFDNAVMTFGVYGENFLQERDKEGHLVHTIEELLDIEPDEATKLHNNTVMGQMLALAMGGQA